MTGYPETVVPSFCECGDHAFAPLNLGYVVLVSPEDADLLRQKWTALRTARSAVVRRKFRVGPDRVTIVMSRMILGAKTSDQWVDHANCDSTDNRRPNLRMASPAENAWNRRKARTNSGGFKCVYFSRGKFTATIMTNGKRRYLGRFDTAEQAHSAYVAAAVRLHGEFARAA